MLKDLKFILKENVIRFDEKGNIIPGAVSNVGYKFTFGSGLYGSYMVICKPTVTPQDIMESLESLCPEIEQLLNEFAADVVPKSEVEKLVQDVTRLEQEKDALIKNYSECMKDYARGIFEEIRKRAYSERGLFVVNSDIDDFIAELKKKYTGDQSDV